MRNKPVVGITLDKELLRKIDKARNTTSGMIARSTFIESILNDRVGTRMRLKARRP